MKSIIVFRKLLKSIKYEVLIEWSFFLVFMIFLLSVNYYNKLFFHTAMEIFVNFIFIVVFVFAFNTYRINKNCFLVILGTGYFFVGVLGIFHLLLSPGMPFLSYIDGMNIATQIWISSRYMGVFTFLVAMIFMLKPDKRANIYIVFISYFFITMFILVSILIIKVFPDCFAENVGLTSFKVISEYFLCIVFFCIAAAFFTLRKNVNRYLFICLESFLILSGICEMFFTNYISPFKWTNVIGHIITVIAAYFMYKGVVETGLRRPYKLINENLNLADRRVELFEEIILTNEQCFNMVINNSDNAIFVISDNKLVFANRRMAELLGAKKFEDIIGLEVENILTDEFKDAAFERINNAVYNRGSCPFTESKLMRLDGKEIDIEVTNCFCMYEGKTSAMVMFRDITPRKQIQLLQNDALENKRLINKTNELNKMMTEFFSNISHELKTPLNVILGAVQILSLPSKGSNIAVENLKTSKYLKTIKQNCYRLVRLVNNLIDISKFDSGYFKVDLHNYNVVRVVEDITLSVADYAKNKGIELLFDTDVEEKEMAIDLDKIERIVLNLLSNAIKFTNEGGQILVSVWDKGDKALISIKDNGIGMPKDKLDVIFERFGQVEKTLVRNKEGSGIGLSLVKSIVDMHDGNIKALSEDGKGSEFIIELPVRLVEVRQNSDGRLYESKVEKISIEFADIYSL